MVGLPGTLINSLTMYKFKIELIYNEEKPFYTETELLNFNFTLPSAKLDIVGSRLVLNSLIFSDDILVDIELVTFLLLSNISKLSIAAKLKKFW